MLKRSAVMGVGEGSTVTKKETLSHAAKVSRMQRVYDMMREGEWKEVCNDLQIFIKSFCTRCARSSKARMSIERHFFSGFAHRRLDPRWTLDMDLDLDLDLDLDVN